jgi:hypothetical protein
VNDAVLARVADTIAQRRAAADPASSYVAKLAAKGLDAMLKKVGEEATEFVMAAKDGDARSSSARRPTSGSTACWRWPSWACAPRPCWPNWRAARGSPALQNSPLERSLPHERTSDGPQRQGGGRALHRKHGELCAAPDRAVGAVLPGFQPSVLLLVLAVIIDMVMGKKAQGSWQESHFRYRLRSVILAAIAYALTLPLVVSVCSPRLDRLVHRLAVVPLPHRQGLERVVRPPCHRGLT